MNDTNLPTPLVNLVKFEKRIQSFLIGNSNKIKANINKKNSSISIDVSGKVFHSQLKRNIIHQLGRKIFSSNSWGETNYKWSQVFERNFNELEFMIEESFKNQQIIIKYFENKGVNEIYGLVTPNFTEYNQIEFREDFLKEAQPYDFIKKSLNCKINCYGQVVETFEINHEFDKVKFNLLLQYGQNNGYSAIKAIWERLVIICSNGLVARNAKTSKLIHSIHSNSDSFTQNLIRETSEEVNSISNRIDNFSDKKLDSELVNSFFDCLIIANATKDRIKDRIQIEKKVHGNTEWALSQSLTWLGTHETAITSYSKQVLTRAGTGILENGLSEFLKNSDQSFLKN